MEGTTLAGRYAIHRMIGRGGMAEVYAATHQPLGRAVAVKVPCGGADATVVERVLREGRALASLDHPAVVRIFDCGALEDGRPYLVMERLDGWSLGTHIARRGPVGARDAVELLRPVASALDAAHARGMVHRDLKPGNVVVTRLEGGSLRLRILDFGLVVFLDPSTASKRLTASGIAVGTPRYMAPEAATCGAIDHRADIYALGVLIYEMLTARAPFAGDSVDVLVRKATESPPALGRGPRRFGASLEAVVARALARRPEDRHATAGLLLRDLQAAVDGQPVLNATRVLGARAPLLAEPRASAPVLVAEADPELSSWMSRGVQAWGGAPVVAASAAEACALAATDRPGAIVVSDSLADASGPELLALLRDAGHRAPAAFLSRRWVHTASRRFLAKELGVVVFGESPAPRDELGFVIRRLLAGRSPAAAQSANG